MAGYIFLIGSSGTIQQCIESGIYSTVIKSPHGYWSLACEATFADYVSMKAGDNIYFFQDRKIYGVGALTNVGPDCKYKNYPQASIPRSPSYSAVQADMLYDNGPDSINLRWLCTFKPAPAFFINGVDMDDVLSAAPEHFRMIRAMQQVSFMKLDDEENRALRDHIIFRNRLRLGDQAAHHPYHDAVHVALAPKVTADHMLTATDIMDCCVNTDGLLKHEMALECGLVDAIAHHRAEADIIGKWDYISHQVLASPFKPLIYVDKMDIFGYKYIPGLPAGYDTLSDFLILELKREEAGRDSVEQVMKYVEWVKQEYAFGDYSRIKALVVAGSFTQEAVDAIGEIAVRYYTYGSHPSVTDRWNEVTLLRYRYNSTAKALLLERV